MRLDDATPLTRQPDKNLLIYYALGSLVLGPLCFIPMIPLYFRYHTLRYVFDREGITMRWGILFRREISLTYARIQDIHLVSNVIERWLGLARIQIQTASGASGAEMVIEGLQDFEAIRDALYGRMRGVHAPRGDEAKGAVAAAGNGSDAARAIREAAAELRAVREAVEKGAFR
ncbi:MAG: PH domain-containing protein [Acidobacteria bacterium]|nr:PH domain-containing protein [Acidobacteriota bacterium]